MDELYLGHRERTNFCRRGLHVGRILTNAKYIGIWVYGLTTTLSDSGTETKQVESLVKSG